DDDAGTSCANNANALLHEFQSTIGVMDIARAGKHIKDLACLSYCAEQRIVAPLSFLLFVKAHSCTFRHSSRAQNRPIKIKCHSYHTQSNKSCKNHLPASLPNFNYAFVVNVAQGPADCRNIRHSFESQKTQYHKVITIVIHVPEAAVSKHQMCDQYQSNHMIAIYRAYRQMIKTHTEPSLKIKIRKQLLNDNRTGKRSKPLVLEFKLRNFVDMGENLCFTIFHFQWPPDLGYFETRNSNFNQSGGRFTRSLSLLIFIIYATTRFTLPQPRKISHTPHPNSASNDAASCSTHQVILQPAFLQYCGRKTFAIYPPRRSTAVLADWSRQLQAFQL